MAIGTEMAKPKSLVVGVLACLALSALLQSSQADIVAGHDYVVLDTPQPQENNGKIEVVEFFSWACPHCYEFYPMLSRWAAALPKEVTLKRVPVSFSRPEWGALARTYYALQATGDAERLDSEIFEAIHRDHLALFDEMHITVWVGRHGVDVEKFTAAFRSKEVGVQVGQADQQAMDVKITGVPTLAIAGQYVVSGDHEAMLTTSSELIERVRAAKNVSVQ
jgi:thiol:disulfide interchange protein DsbA